MADKVFSIPGWSGVDNTTDPLILHQKDPTRSSLAYNYRAKNMIRKGRHGYQNVLTTGQTGYLKKSGLYFPDGAKAVLPHTKDSYLSPSFYLASDSQESKEFSIEFWYKCDYQVYDRTICTIPMNFGAGKTKHMTIEFSPIITGGASFYGKTYLVAYLLIGDDGTPETVYQTSYISLATVPTDSEWHHISVVRASGGTMLMYVDEATAVVVSAQDVQGGDAIIRNDTIEEQHSTPLMYNHLEIGSGGLRIADFRIWDVARSRSEILSDYDQELLGSESDLIVYCPFNEGTGNHFENKVDSTRGYLTPQEPYVDSSDRLVFTGINCMAYPSLRAKYAVSDALQSDDAFQEVQDANSEDRNEDGGYDGGILWDDDLYYAGSPDESHYQNGINKGIAQMRIVLRQLKEGILCGRLGLTFDTTAGAYRLFFCVPGHSTLGHNDKVYLSDAVVDSSWIGVEKTITIKYYGDSNESDDTVCLFYVDHVEVTDSSPTTLEWIWANGDDILSTDYVPVVNEDEPEGMAIGGSTVHTEMCIAFDLIFLRQWWDDVIGGDMDDFVEDTYDVEKLPDVYRFVMEGIDGYFTSGVGSITLELSEDLFGTEWASLPKVFIKIPIHGGSDGWDMSAGAGAVKTEYSIIRIDRGVTLDDYFKQDILIKKVIEWDTADNILSILFEDSGTNSYKLSACFGTGDAATRRRYFNGAVLSSLVCCYEPSTFKLNEQERPYFYEDKTDDREVMALKITNTIEDDSPLQGIERFGSEYYKSRYLILATDSRYNTIHGMRSFHSRWCTGPDTFTPVTLPAVRGIFRYKSEDGKIDKLLVAAHSSIFEVNASTGVLTELDEAWLDSNSGEIVNVAAINNRLVVMDTKTAIKINHKGNWTRLGIERPVDIVLDADIITAGDPTWDFNGKTWESGDEATHRYCYHFGYAAQFYDEENNVYSGMIPVFSLEGQSIKLMVNNGAVEFNYIDVSIRACKDKNVDRCRVFRTLDMGTGNTGVPTGSEGSLFLVKDCKNTAVLHEFNNFRDCWKDREGSVDFLAAQPYLDFARYGSQDLVPKACAAMGVGYGRLFLFNAEKNKSFLYWSDVDELGFGKPDQFPASQAIVMDEGNTTEGKALVEFSGQLFAYKDDAIFIVTRDQGGNFGYEAVYKGVGAINQRCVIAAKQSILSVDRNGIWAYRGGEPELLTKTLLDYFEDEVNQDEIDRAFLLYQKEEDLVLAFLPSSNATYCDRCIVINLREGTFTLDIVPSVTCGFVDNDGTIYLGTPYGQVLKYDKSSYLDVVTSEVSGTGEVDTNGDLTDTGAFSAFLTHELTGAPVYLIDETNKKIWKGIITENDDDTITVDRWDPLFNTTDTTPIYASISYSVGGIYLYDKTSMVALFNDYWDKQINAYEFLGNKLGSAQDVYTRLALNHDDVEVLKSTSFTGDNHLIPETGGAHRVFQLEHALVTTQQFDVKRIAYHGIWERGQHDQ